MSSEAESSLSVLPMNYVLHIDTISLVLCSPEINICLVFVASLCKKMEVVVPLWLVNCFSLVGHKLCRLFTVCIL